MGLYIVYIINVKDNAAFSHFEDIPDYIMAMIAVTAVFCAVYLIWFVITIFVNLFYIRKMPSRSKYLFLYSIFMLLICIASVIFGVYSPYYTNGGLILFFIGIFNVYVWSLIYLNWPAEYQQLIN